MSDPIQTILDRNIPLPEIPRERPWEADVGVRTEAVIKAVGDQRDLVWGSMIYACRGAFAKQAMPESLIEAGIESGYIEAENADQYRTTSNANPRSPLDGAPAHRRFRPCGYEHRVLLGVGIGGPPALKEAGYTLPAPFYCGTCPVCGGSMAHVRFHEDEEYEPRPRPNGPGAYFIVPDHKTAKRNVERGYHGADYVPLGEPGS